MRWIQPHSFLCLSDLATVNLHWNITVAMCKWERAMCDLNGLPGIHVEKMIGVYTGNRAYHFDGLDVLPVERFLKRLHAGTVF